MTPENFILCAIVHFPSYAGPYSWITVNAELELMTILF